MLFSKLFAPTLKEPPKDAVLKSHKHLAQAGYIHQIGSGVYNLLPLAKKVVNKIEKITHKRMQEHGVQELLMSFVVPASLWEKSGRLDKYGKELLVFKDRKDNDFVLSPTLEENITEIASNFIKSYKQLPIHLYQIHTKFRDEIRPRFGLVRAREFIMKDGYSFHENIESLDKEFLNTESAYKEILSDLGLDFRIVEADSGAIGGNKSKEFVVLTECGEDTIVVCQNCDYAANIEIAKRSKRLEPLNVPKANFAKFPTPNITSIESVAEFFKIEPYFVLKAVVKKVIHKDKETLACFFTRGDDNLEETKALNALNALGASALELVDASKDDLEKAGLVAGFVGPYGLKKHVSCIVFDEDLKDCDCLIAGANEKDFHVVGVNLEEFENLVYADIIQVKESDNCPCCKGALRYHKSLEVGHIFKLGQGYAKSLKASFLDKNGKEQFFEMGCYGIGISRLLSAILEQKSDDLGCVWTKNTAPFDVVIVVSNLKDESQKQLAFEVYERLLKKGVDVLLDDRDVRFGAKMRDFELIGERFALIIGKQTLESKKFECIKRSNLEKQMLKDTELEDKILEMLESE
ncbi:proline--tRNA ligase [Helicobacter cetorum]|uniref:Proline--tRNA ligase n=1 Tax=Helicobacter cetorum (strain ATCC BAA-540 / CCUG 52418 / MIT 99-5656) TaxID=1163745 RepID=I0ETH5_HELCM|nr:proline--tRNA ligase [Helicobacter cetorum]AFI06244.1 prolyl-tRNA synthetase [Helicobacter cetorum MIT 99-5656]